MMGCGAGAGALGGLVWCVGEEGARQPGKSPEKEPRIFQTGWAGPLPRAAWKPRGCGGGGGGRSGKSHLSPKPGRTGWGTG